MPIVTVLSAFNLLSLAAFFVSLSLQFLAAIFPGVLGLASTSFLA
jgi:hypothetical protein